MTPERWKQVSQVYDAARARPASERAAFLALVCGGDETLRREVQSLLDQPTSPPMLDALTPLAVAPVVPDITGAHLIGRQFGVYLVQERIGTGGMGEVYRAHDTRLGRDVAIKVLPPAVAQDPDRLARFEREARVLAALDHPHIGAIHGVEESEGVRGLVLALVEGDTLAERVARGPLPIPDALEYARQIADALEAAHDKGIVHRDLKPANIKITPAGTVKVLDFGLAKTGVLPSETAMTALPGNATRSGVMVGTPAYMSPEQARGQAVDKRADIWAFGCVLYEMLTGRDAFAGETPSDALASILEREPDWSVLPASVPASIARMLQRCLEKNPKRRWHDIADVRIEIEDVLGPGSRDPIETPVHTNAAEPLQRRRSIALIASLAALVGIAALTTWSVWSKSRGTAAPFLERTTITSPRATVDAFSSLAITPDGTRIVYTGNERTQLFVRPLDQLEPNLIYTASAPLNGVLLSPDGKWVGFVEGGLLKKIAITGGPVTAVAQMGTGPQGATWLPDDTIIFAGPSDDPRGLDRVSSQGGPVTPVTRPDQARGEVNHAWPETLPGGRAVLYTITANTGGLDAAQIAVLDLATNRSTVLVGGGRRARYVSSGHLVYTVGRDLVAVPFDPDRLQVLGKPVQVLPRIANEQGAHSWSSSADGTLAYVDAPGPGGPLQLTMVWVDRHGVEEPLGAPTGDVLAPRLSPDGKRVAVGIDRDIFIWDLERRQPLKQLTFEPGYDFFHTWMPDSRSLVFYSARGGGAIYRQPVDGTGAAEALSDGMGGFGMLPSSVTPDGSRALFSVGGRDLMALTLDGSRRIEPLIQTPANERNGIVSPDGRWLVYESDRSGQFEIYVRPYPNVDSGQELKVSATGGAKPAWTRGGRELLYVAPDGAIMGVPVDASDRAWSAGYPARIVDGPYKTRGADGVRPYDVSADGERFLMLKLPPFDPATTVQIQRVKPWFEELKRLAPVN